MLDLADLRTRLEAQLAAVAEAEAAIARVHALCGLSLPARSAVEARGEAVAVSGTGQGLRARLQAS